jgi:hypothetical protein
VIGPVDVLDIPLPDAFHHHRHALVACRGHQQVDMVGHQHIGVKGNQLFRDGRAQALQGLEEAMREHEAPFYLRRVKEALVTFPDPETGDVRQLFTRRRVQTAPFHINGEEMDFYDELTRYVEDQSIKASEDDSARGRALGFTMAMLQRRFASSVYAVRRSLERMKATREKILADPDAYRQKQILKRILEDFEDLPDDEQQDIMLCLEEVVPSIDPASLRDEIARLTKLIDAAQVLEASEIETKLTKLQDVITEQGVFGDPKMKLLIFTEHKDTLDYLVGKLEAWGLSVTQIHGGMRSQIIFDKQFLKRDPTLEWVTPGHPLFEAVRDDVGDKTGEDIQRGAVFYTNATKILQELMS